MALVWVYLVALIINHLAPTFGGQKDVMQALKTVAYSYTAAWIACLGHIVPWVGMAILILGSVYSTVTGSAPDIGILKNAARGIDLEGLAALKDEGVQ